LAPGTVVWFTPGTIHRAINDSGDLRVLVVMQNSGLPENGDAVLTFPAKHLVDGGAYLRAASLTFKDADAGDPAAEAAARRRRDLALEGYLELKAGVLESGVSALVDFHAAAARLVSVKTDSWRGLLNGGAQHQAAVTEQQLNSLGSSESFYLREARTTMGERKTGRIYGMCGRIQAWELSETASVGT